MRDDPWAPPPRNPDDDPPETPQGWPPPQGYPPATPPYPPPPGPYAPSGPRQGFPPGPPSRPHYPPSQPGYPSPARPNPNGPPSGYPPRDPGYGPPSGYPPTQPGYGSGYAPQEDYAPRDGRYGPPPGYGQPAWPTQSGDAGYGRAPQEYAPPHWAEGRATERVAAVPRERAAPRDHNRRGIRLSFPIEHLLLAVGIVAMFLALSQPWGSDAQGHAIYLSPIAHQAAYYTLAGMSILGGLLVLLRQRLGCLFFVGCLGLFAIPLLVAATLGGIEVLTQLHVVPHITPENVKMTNRGFFLWWGGLAVTLVGLLFEVLTHRRKLLSI